MTSANFTDAALAARTIADRVGPEIRMAVPIGIGKPVLLVNALYRLVESDPRLSLTIFTGLTPVNFEALHSRTQISTRSLFLTARR